MGFIWAKNDIASMSATLYETNITLNRAGCEPFNDVRYVLVGVDEEKREIGIHPVTKDEIELNLYPSNHLHKISIGKSYGRISNKRFMQEIQNLFHLDFNKDKGAKYDAYYDEEESVLRIHV